MDSIRKDTPGFNGDGYTSLSIIYFVFSLSNWLAPSIVATITAKWSMIFGAVLYTAFIASFLYPVTWLLYLMSAVLGLGAAGNYNFNNLGIGKWTNDLIFGLFDAYAVIWTAQGSYLTLSSTTMTMSRNSGIFWAILQSSMFFGNSFVFWQFEGKGDVIDEQTRNLVFSVLTGVAVIGIIVMCFLRTPQ